MSQSDDNKKTIEENRKRISRIDANIMKNKAKEKPAAADLNVRRRMPLSL